MMSFTLKACGFLLLELERRLIYLPWVLEGDTPAFVTNQVALSTYTVNQTTYINILNFILLKQNNMNSSNFFILDFANSIFAWIASYIQVDMPLFQLGSQ